MDSKNPSGVKGRAEVYDWIQCIIFALVFCVLLFVFAVRMVNVVGHSMVPTLEQNDKVVISNLFYHPKQGDIVVLRKQTLMEEPIVKRIIATEGQTVDIDFETGDVSVDGELLREDYINALTTAGITDAKVIVTAPFDVSGTAALTGIYKAYEDITGSSLNEIAKAVGVEELITTGNLAEYIGSEEATQLVNGLKEILDQTQTMTDEEVKAEIDKLCETYNVSLNDSQKNQLVSLCRSLEKLDTDELKDKLVGIAKTVDNAGKIGQTVSKIGESIKSFFASVGNFFTRLFGGNK